MCFDHVMNEFLNVLKFFFRNFMVYFGYLNDNFTFFASTF